MFKLNFKVLQIVVIFIASGSYISFAQIPNATKQPKWVFPLYFEEGKGMRDTIYIGYDPSAIYDIGKHDTIFGEKWIVADSINFFATLIRRYIQPQSMDSISNIHIIPDLNAYFNIEFINAEWPITMKFDVSLFYSDSLPYPDVTSTGLNGYAELPCQESNPDPSYHTCDPWIPLRLSDDPLNYFYSVTDSVVFIGDNNSVHTPDNGGIYLPLMIKPYGPPSIINKKTINSENIKVYPNPFTDEIKINCPNAYSFKLCSIEGIVVMNDFSLEGNNLIITKDLKAGVYFLYANINKQMHIYKLIKL